MIPDIAGSPDHCIAVVSTDQSSPSGEQQGLLQSILPESPPYEITDSAQGRDCRGAGIARGRFRGPSPTTRMNDSSRIGVDEQGAEFKGNVLVGSCGPAPRKARSRRSWRSGAAAVAAFFAPEASLVVVFVSNEDDQSIDTCRSTTTWEADERLKAEGLGPEARRKKIDAYAAAVMLQEVLDKRAAQAGAPAPSAPGDDETVE